MKEAWHLERIGALAAWGKTLGTHETTIAIIDGGVDYNHVELSANMRRKASEWPSNGVDDDKNGFIDDFIGWDWITGKNLPYDRTGHGTMLAGIAAGRKDNGWGAAGVCPKCSLLPLRFMNWEGLGDTEDAISAIEYAAKEKVSVLNLSFSAEGFDLSLKRAIEEAGRADIVVVVAASNDGENLDYASTYPAKLNLPHMLTVAAIDSNDELLESSNWGKKTVHVGAPGDEIWGPWLGEVYAGSGTSYAAAVVSGAVGLLRSARPELKADSIVKVIKATARKTKSLEKSVSSGGVVDVAAAMACLGDPRLGCLKR